MYNGYLFPALALGHIIRKPQDPTGSFTGNYADRFGPFPILGNGLFFLRVHSFGIFSDGDQINIAFDITGADIGGNSIQAPIDFTTTVIDGDDPAPQNVTFENVESSSTPITGTFVDIGSDQLATVTFNQEGLSQFDGLLSDNQATEAVLSEDGSTITLSIAGSNETVLTISLNTDGTYQFEQFKPLEQTNGEDTIELSLPTTIVDFDQDTASNTFTMTILDGDNPVIENVTGLSRRGGG